MSQGPCFPDAGKALAEVRRIIAERAAHPKWITTAAALVRRADLAEAERILEKAGKMTYFEGSDGKA